MTGEGIPELVDMVDQEGDRLCVRFAGGVALVPFLGVFVTHEP